MADVTIAGVPESVTAAELKEWCSVLIQRKEEKKLSPPEAEVLASRKTIDDFRKANSLEAKYEEKPKAE